MAWCREGSNRTGGGRSIAGVEFGDSMGVMTKKVLKITLSSPFKGKETFHFLMHVV